MKRKMPLLWLLALLANILFLIFLKDHLPERFAVHFDINGKPNGWATKSTFISPYVIMILITNGLVGGIYAFAERFPPTLINIPNKGYWFSTTELASKGYEIVKGILAYTGVFLNGVFLVCSYVIYQETGAPVFFRIDSQLLFWGIMAAAVLLVVGAIRSAQVPK